jgi:hypothetical protein
MEGDAVGARRLARPIQPSTLTQAQGGGDGYWRRQIPAATVPTIGSNSWAPR